MYSWGGYIMPYLVLYTSSQHDPPVPSLITLLKSANSWTKSSLFISHFFRCWNPNFGITIWTAYITWPIKPPLILMDPHVFPWFSASHRISSQTNLVGPQTLCYVCWFLVYKPQKKRSYTPHKPNSSPSSVCPLVMTNSSLLKMAIEIGDLPIKDCDFP